MKSLYLIYALNTVLPTLFLLFNLSTTVFVMGEYKENGASYPTVLKILLLKIISIALLQILILHYVFENKVSNNFQTISIILGLFVMIETYFTQKFLKTIHSYVKNISFTRMFENELNLKERSQKVIKNNRILLIIIKTLLVAILTIVVLNIFKHFSVFNLVVLCTILFIASVKYILYNHIKTI